MGLLWRGSSMLLLFLVIAVSAFLNLSSAHDAHSGSCPFSGHAGPLDHHGDDHNQGCQHHHHHHHHGHHQHHHYHEVHDSGRRKLPEELAEEEDLELDGFDDEHHDHELSTLGLWVSAMGCSLLVSMASLICLILLPVLFLRGKPSKIIVDSLAVFGAGAMLGDAFLHQLPHAFGGEHSHSHDHHGDKSHDHHHELADSHSHSLRDLSVGLSILSGIVLFLLVEKVVRYVEDVSGKGAQSWGHGHHHHQQKSHQKLKADENKYDKANSSELSEASSKETLKSFGKFFDGNHDDSLNDKPSELDILRKRGSIEGSATNGTKDLDAANSPVKENLEKTMSNEAALSPSSIVFGYLNLFSDGVHNFTDGMALGSAFLIYGPVGGWSRTLFLLAHELPQEVGDFGILVRSGFTVSKALFFNFLSALAALAGTALALLLGKDPGQSSLIEGFTAGGFIYIAVAGVLPEMNNGKTTIRSTAIQLFALVLGMAIALGISLAE